MSTTSIALEIPREEARRQTIIKNNIPFGTGLTQKYEHVDPKVTVIDTTRDSIIDVTLNRR
jgi:hypothetical protein